MGGPIANNVAHTTLQKQQMQRAYQERLSDLATSEKPILAKLHQDKLLDAMRAKQEKQEQKVEAQGVAENLLKGAGNTQFAQVKEGPKKTYVAQKILSMLSNSA